MVYNNGFVNGPTNGLTNGLSSGLPSGLPNGVTNGFQNAGMNQQQSLQPMQQSLQPMQQMSQALTVSTLAGRQGQCFDPQTMLKNILTATDGPHAIMLAQLNTFNNSLKTFNRNAAQFTSNMVQLANAMNARMNKAEYERNRLQAALSRQYPSGSLQVPQTAPEFGARNARFREGDDMPMSSPDTPSKPPRFNIPQITVTARSSSEEPESSFGSKLTGKKNQKSEKTKARKELQIKVPGQSSRSTLGLPTPNTKSAVCLPFTQTNNIQYPKLTLLPHRLPV